MADSHIVNTPQPVRNSLVKKLVGLLILVVIIVIMVLVIKSQSRPTSGNQTANDGKEFSYTYSSLKTIKLEGDKPRQTATFDVPNEFSQVKQQHPTPQYEQLIHRVNGQAVGGASISSTNSTIPVTDAYLSGLNNSISNYKKSTDNPFDFPLKNAATRLIGSQYNVTLGQAQPFTNANITSNAWVWDFSASPANQKSNQPAYMHKTGLGYKQHYRKHHRGNQKLNHRKAAC